ncbi:MAG: PPK2 family polyphosphate kinase [Gemmatimonas sp.]
MTDISAHLLDGLSLQPVKHKDKPSLDDKDARLAAVPPKQELKKHTDALLERLAELQDAFHADGRRALLLVLQGRDASGKDGTIKNVYGAFNPTGVRVASFGPPSELERQHDFLWRIHNVIPPRGMIGVFNRSHYEDVLVVRVRGLATKAVWKERYEQINNFEAMLAANDVVIRKCFLHVSRDEQKERLSERLADPQKNWKFRLGDLDDRNLWDDYTAAYEDALSKCSTKHAPWYVVPADSKAVRNYLVTRLMVETLEGMDLRYPAMAPEVAAAARGFE